MFLTNFEPRATLHEDKWSWNWSCFTTINFIIPLHASYLKYSQGNCWKLSRCLPKQVQKFVGLLQSKDCRGTAEVNDVFKLLPQLKNCQRLYSWTALLNARYWSSYVARSFLISLCIHKGVVNECSRPIILLLEE